MIIKVLDLFISIGVTNIYGILLANPEMFGLNYEYIERELSEYFGTKVKIKGKKIIKAKTNAKGKATFKIKKLTKKGKYNAVVKFKGNKNYKASTKKVKITVKK